MGSRQVKIVTTRVTRPNGGMALGVHRLRMNEKGVYRGVSVITDMVVVSRH